MLFFSVRPDGFGGGWWRSLGLVPLVLQLCMLSFVRGQDLGRFVLVEVLDFAVSWKPQHDWTQGVDY